MKLLIADDEEIIRRGLTGLDWETVGITEVRSVENGMDALQCVPRWQPDIILTDIKMAGMDGLAFSKEMHASGRRYRLIILSGYGTFEYAQAAIRSGVFEFLLKPSNPEEILAAIGRAVKDLQEETEKTTAGNPVIRQDGALGGRGQASLIDEVLRYIEQNYMKDITLQSLSEYTHYSVAYLSRMIKKETSYNFTKILSVVRMTKAAELLTGTDLKVYEICEHIGIEDYRYFGQVFAKTFGRTPLEYRKAKKQTAKVSLLDFIKLAK